MPHGIRKFMVVVDDTPECRIAMRFAARRAEHTGGGVTLLRVIEPADFQHWMSVEEIMRQEAREEAERLLKTLSDELNALTGVIPEFVIREGTKRDEVLAHMREDPYIRVLVLGAGTDKEGPGPLVSALAGEMAGSLPVPITVVPGGLTNDQIDELT